MIALIKGGFDSFTLQLLSIKQTLYEKGHDRKGFSGLTYVAYT